MIEKFYINVNMYSTYCDSTNYVVYSAAMH